VNVDEAIEIATSTAITLTKLEMAEVADVLAAEVERLRAWNKRWRDVSAKLRLTLAELSEELAAAKAASVVPVKVNSVWADHGSGRVTAYCKNLDDAMKFESWLRDRMKERVDK